MAKRCAICGQGVLAGKGPIVNGYFGLQDGTGLTPVHRKGDTEWAPIPHHDSCFQDAARRQMEQAARIKEHIEGALPRA